MKRSLNQELIKFWLWCNMLEVMIHGLSPDVIENCLECKKYTGSYRIAIPDTNIHLCHQQEFFDNIFLMNYKRNSKKCIKPFMPLVVGLDLSESEDNVIYETFADIEAEDNSSSFPKKISWTSFFSSLYSLVFTDKSDTCIECVKSHRIFASKRNNPSKLEQFQSLIFGSSIVRNVKGGICKSKGNKEIYELERTYGNILINKSKLISRDDHFVSNAMLGDDNKNDSMNDYISPASDRSSEINIVFYQGMKVEDERKNMDYADTFSHENIKGLSGHLQFEGDKATNANLSVVTTGSDDSETVRLQLPKKVNSSESLINPMSNLKKDWYTKFINYLRLSCPYSFEKSHCEDCDKENKLRYEFWYYWFQDGLKLYTQNKQHVASRDEDSDFEKWWINFVWFLKIRTANPSRVDRIDYFIEKKVSLYETWYYFFRNALKLSSPNKLKMESYDKRKGIGKWLKKLQPVSKVKSVAPTTVLDTNDFYSTWYHRFVSSFKLYCKAGMLIEKKENYLLNTEFIMEDDESKKKNEIEENVYRKKSMKTTDPLIEPDISASESFAKEVNLFLKHNKSDLLLMDGKAAKLQVPKMLFKVLRREKILVMPDKWKRLAKRVYRGEVYDSAVIAITSIMMIMFLWRSSLNPGFLMNFPAKESTTQFKSKSPLLKTPAVVLAARKKLELELVVAIVEIYPYTSIDYS